MKPKQAYYKSGQEKSGISSRTEKSQVIYFSFYPGGKHGYYAW
jgi:hypothetical protein